MFKRLRNNRGVVPAGILFAGGHPAGSIFAVIVALAVTYTMQPGTLKEFRYRKAVEKCEASGQSNCKTMVDQMSLEERLSYIKDDDPGTAVQWSDMLPRLGG